MKFLCLYLCVLFAFCNVNLINFEFVFGIYFEYYYYKTKQNLINFNEVRNLL